MSVPGVTCRDCLGRIDAAAVDFKRKASAKLGKPYTPPVLCSECVVAVMLKFAMEEDPTDAE